MASITTRAGKGSPLTNAELDANFSNLNTALDGKSDTTHNHTGLYDLAGTAAAAVSAHASNIANPHSVTKAQVGLGNVDNTSDANKPISSAAAAALSGKQATVEKNLADGYAGLDSTGRVPAELMPVFFQQSNRINTDAVIPDGFNAFLIDPVEIGPNVTVTGLGNSTLRGI